jgi:hypothetical protein
MSIEDEVAEIRAELAHDYQRRREAAVKRAGVLLQTGQAAEELVPLLRDVAADLDNLSFVREAAQRAVDEWQRAQWAKLPGAPADVQHRFPVRCQRCDHVTWFDKRRVCGPEGSIKRERVLRDGRTLDRLTLTCQRCGETLKADVECEGYR